MRYTPSLLFAALVSFTLVFPQKSYSAEIEVDFSAFENFGRPNLVNLAEKMTTYSSELNSANLGLNSAQQNILMANEQLSAMWTTLKQIEISFNSIDYDTPGQSGVIKAAMENVDVHGLQNSVYAAGQALSRLKGVLSMPTLGEYSQSEMKNMVMTMQVGNASANAALGYAKNLSKGFEAMSSSLTTLKTNSPRITALGIQAYTGINRAANYAAGVSMPLYDSIIKLGQDLQSVNDELAELEILAKQLDSEGLAVAQDAARSIGELDVLQLPLVRAQYEFQVGASDASQVGGFISASTLAFTSFGVEAMPRFKFGEVVISADDSYPEDSVQGVLIINASRDVFFTDKKVTSASMLAIDFVWTVILGEGGGYSRDEIYFPSLGKRVSVDLGAGAAKLALIGSIQSPFQVVDLEVTDGQGTVSTIPEPSGFEMAIFAVGAILLSNRRRSGSVLAKCAA